MSEGREQCFTAKFNQRSLIIKHTSVNYSKDKVKQTGALPRLSEDAPKLENQVIFEPEAQFAPCRALAGQNDYIDILGKFSLNYSTLRC